jgi:hypothetical protein
MSFEGFYEILCQRGHLLIEDAYNVGQFDGEGAWTCGQCHDPAVWWNLVDTTNGTHDEHGRRIDGFVELVMHPQPECVCTACGHKHSPSGPPTYDLPRAWGHYRQPDGTWQVCPEPEPEPRWGLGVMVSTAELQTLSQQQSGLRLLRKYLADAPGAELVQERVEAHWQQLEEAIAGLRYALEIPDA